MEMRVTKNFGCPDCGVGYEEGELIFVYISPVNRILGGLYCKNCGEMINKPENWEENPEPEISRTTFFSQILEIDS